MTDNGKTIWPTDKEKSPKPMVTSMKEKWFTINKTKEANTKAKKHIRTEPPMKANSCMEKSMVLANWWMVIEIGIQGNGGKVSGQALELRRRVGGTSIQVSGSKVNSMEWELRHGIMVIATWVSTKMVKNTDIVFRSPVTAEYTLVIM